MTTTEGDIERAADVVGALGPEHVHADRFVYDGDVLPLVDAVAAALAAERERVLASFLMLADELDQRRTTYADAAEGSYERGLSAAYYIAADRIRRAAS